MYNPIKVKLSTGPIVDGKNPAPVDMVNIPLFTRLYTSQVVQDFFHQQYGLSRFSWKMNLEWRDVVAILTKDHFQWAMFL